MQEVSDDVPGRITYEVADGVATITIDREERRNALTWAIVAELRSALARARVDDAVRVVVLTGAGERAFCAGADLDGMVGADTAELHLARGQLAGLFGDLWGLGRPTIAKVRGFCLAGGLGVALSCDLVVAAEDATFGTPEVDVGLWPYMITVPLCRSMPPKRALELMMTGRRVDAAEAERIGFVNRVVPVDELDDAVAELAGVLTAKSRSVVELGRDSFYATWDMAAAEALSVLHPALGLATGLDDAEEGVAAFRDRRPPRWTDR